MIKPLPLSDIHAGGELARRAWRNFDRLETVDYQPPRVFQAGDTSWPADWEGRTILALTLLAQATHRAPQYLNAILAGMPGQLNERGTMGRILPDGTLDEQQLSGHAWLLRAAVEHFRWRGDAFSRTLAGNIVDNLLLPAHGYYAQYPSRPEQRILTGEAIGTLTGDKIGNWYSSTDIGCAFIMLDGASQAYEQDPQPELHDLLLEMARKFAEIDLVAISAQTHATLSATRGLLRFYESTGEAWLLDLARRTFALYRSEGMTENYANYNWFGRPDWTEPCAVVDSFIVATTLWRLTGVATYLEDAHHILYNGLGYGQRPNGGFGCDTCAGARDEFLAPSEGAFEAFWCCTMRGGEGMARAIEYGWFMDGDTLVIPFFSEGLAHVRFEDGEEAVLRQWTDAPRGGRVALEVVHSTVSRRRTVRLHRPSWSPAARLAIDGTAAAFGENGGFIEFEWSLRAGARVDYEFEVPLRAAPVIGRHNLAGHHTWRHGYLLLGTERREDVVRPVGPIGPMGEPHALGQGCYQFGEDGARLAPVGDLFEKTTDEARRDRRQVLFVD